MRERIDIREALRLYHTWRNWREVALRLPRTTRAPFAADAVQAAVRRFDAAITPGVTERRPIPGVVYHGFVVHPRQPGPVTLAIAHRAGKKIILDLCRDGLTTADAVDRGALQGAPITNPPS